MAVWAQLDHDNVLPLLGYTRVESSPLPALVSPLCTDNLKSYLELRRKKPLFDEDKSNKAPLHSPLRFVSTLI